MVGCNKSLFLADTIFVTSVQMLWNNMMLFLFTKPNSVWVFNVWLEADLHIFHKHVHRTRPVKGDATASVNHYHNLPEIIAFFCLHQVIVHISIYYTKYTFLSQVFIWYINGSFSNKFVCCFLQTPKELKSQISFIKMFS